MSGTRNLEGLKTQALTYVEAAYAKGYKAARRDIVAVGNKTNLQSVINQQAAKGYRLHTISTASSGSKGFLGGDKIQATMVFERLD